MRILFLFFVLGWALSGTAQPLMLYSTSETPGRGYLLSRITNDQQGFVSEVITAETFRVRSTGDGFCTVTMSNAFVYRTMLGNELSFSKTNQVKQFRVRSGVVALDFLATTQIIFNERTTYLSQVDLGQTKLLPQQGKSPKQSTTKQQATNGLNSTKPLRGR